MLFSVVKGEREVALPDGEMLPGSILEVATAVVLSTSVADVRRFLSEICRL